MSKKLISTADKFTELFDNDWKRNTRSAVRTRCEDSRSYDPSYSWEAKGDDPREFSKLDKCAMPVQHTRPITLSGAAVIPMDRITGFEVLNVFDNRNPKPHTSCIPLTQDQRDLGMKPDFSCQIPRVNDALGRGGILVVEENPCYKNMSMQPTIFKEVQQPSFMVEAGPQCDQRLLNPSQRREILDFEKRKKAADEKIRSSMSDREKTKKQLSGLQFRRGVLMVDSADNVDSEIYGERAAKQISDINYKSQIHRERRAQLSLKGSCMNTNGNILVPTSIDPRVKAVPNYQSKGGHYHGLQFDETHNRLFCRRGEKAPLLLRTQNIRDNDIAGKHNNLITHTLIEHWPGHKFERLENKNMHHQSQNTLEGTRSLQGAMKSQCWGLVTGEGTR